MLIHKRLYSKLKGNVLFLYNLVTKYPNVNRQINVTDASLGITSLFVIFILYVKKTDEDKQDIYDATMLVLNKLDAVLLQMVTVVVFIKENSNKKKNVRTLYNRRSQYSFIINHYATN